MGLAQASCSFIDIDQHLRQWGHSNIHSNIHNNNRIGHFFELSLLLIDLMFLCFGILPDNLSSGHGGGAGEESLNNTYY